MSSPSSPSQKEDIPIHMTLSNNTMVQLRSGRAYPTQSHPSMLADVVELSMHASNLMQTILKRAGASVPSNSMVMAMEDEKGQVQYCAALSFDFKDAV